MTPVTTRSTSRADPAIIACLLVLTIAAYWGVWSFGFVNFDDPQYVVLNPHVTSGLSWTNVGWALTTGHAANWHPLTWISHMTDVSWFGVAPGPAHAINLALHAMNAVLLFSFLSRATGAAWPSALVAALFAVHPLHVESVAWIAERKDVLSTFFGLLTLVAYLSTVRRPALARWTLVCVLFALGLMAKPMFVTLPIVMLIVDRWPLGRTISIALVREKIPLFALAAISIVVTILVQYQGGAVAPVDPYPVHARLLHVLTAYVGYLVQTAWPLQLAVFYPLPLVTPIWQAAGAAAILAAITIAAAVIRRSRPYVLAGWLWYLVMLLPVVGLVQVGGQGMADRYTYLPIVGLFIVVAWGLADAVRASGRVRVGAALAGGAAAIAACGTLTHFQLQTWRDSVTLWTHALETTSGNYRAENAVGALLIERDQFAEALGHLANAVRIEPAFADAHDNLGTALARTGQIADAIAQYRESVRLDPSSPLAHNNLGLALAKAPDAAGAVRELGEAVRLDPARADFRYNLAVMLLDTGDSAGGVAELRAALAVQPAFEPARRLLDQVVR
jgi:protein O-mannosyl-transferase